MKSALHACACHLQCVVNTQLDTVVAAPCTTAKQQGQMASQSHNHLMPCAPHCVSGQRLYMGTPCPPWFALPKALCDSNRIRRGCLPDLAADAGQPERACNSVHGALQDTFAAVMRLSWGWTRRQAGGEVIDIFVSWGMACTSCGCCSTSPLFGL